MSRTAWQETIEATQHTLLERPDRCFVCWETVPADDDRCAVQAFRDAAHTTRLAVVCDRASCLRALADAHTGIWDRLFQGKCQNSVHGRQNSGESHQKWGTDRFVVPSCAADRLYLAAITHRVGKIKTAIVA